MPRRLKGVVVSHKMQKSVVVKVDSIKKHSKYLKYYRVSKKFKAHDEENKYRVDDTVIIEETKPISKEKKWRVVELVKRPDVEELMN